MSFDEKEKSRYGGNPVELYRFACNANVWRFASSDENVVDNADGDSQTYVAAPITRSGMEFSQQEIGGAINITVPDDNPVGALMVSDGPSLPVTVTIYRLHYDDGESIVLFVGRVTSAVYEPGMVTMRCMPLVVSMNRRIPRLYVQGPCNWDLYGVGCGVDKAAFKITGTVVGYEGYRIRSAVFDTVPDGWLTHGWVELADQTRRHVLDHVAEYVTLRSPFPNIAPGDTIYGYAGCDRTEETCRTKFSNIVNHLGFKRVPEKNPYTEGMS